jgi:CO/xanthine dehydrogenase FAD-binding subunit
MYIRARSVGEALDALASGGGAILSGGTDFFPALVDRPHPRKIVDISRIEALRGIIRDRDEIRIGPGATWSEVASADLPPSFRALRQAAREVGSVQIQNTATVAGNLCNASPAADGVPPLLCLDAEIEITSQNGTRRVPLCDFILGNRKTVLKPDELVTAIAIPAASANGVSHFSKLGARRYLVISIVMVAARIALSPDGSIAEARVAVGSCSAAALRLRSLERDLTGRPAAAVLSGTIGPHHLSPLSPIDDVRGSGAYRLDAALELVRRTVDACLAEQTHG